MIIYQALSTYQILECIEHRKLYHQNENAVLILGTYIVEKFASYELIANFGFFDEVYLFDFGEVGNYNDAIIVQTIEERLKSTLPFDITSAHKIYIAGIHTYLSLYLVAKKIRFSMFEDGSGALSRPWILANIAQKSTPQKYNIINKYGLYDHSSELIQEKWCNKSAQLKNYKDGKIKYFDVVEGFEKLSNDDQIKLLKFFGINKKINIEKNSILLLTQQFSNLGQLSFENHIRIYQYLFDFYLVKLKKKIILKLHPDDIMYYEKLFRDIKIVREVFPSELLPYVFEYIPQKVVTISSTGVNLIRDKFEECIEFNEEYETTFAFDPVYYVVTKLLSRMNINEIDFIGVNEKQLKNILKCNECDIEIYKRKGNSFKASNTLLVDDFGDEMIRNLDIREYSTIIYCNSLRKYQFYDINHKEQFNSMFPIEISLRSYKNTENGLAKWNYMIWIYTEEKRYENIMKNFSCKEDLENTKAIITTNTFTKEELEIMRLRGLLDATERRLLDYIKREKELTQKLKEKEF